MAASENNKAHKIIVRAHIEEALRCEKGKNASLTSFDVKDFTADGDGNMSCVTSVDVYFLIDGKDEKTSYVVKLNNDEKKEKDTIAADMFFKEDMFYNVVLPEMNSTLRKYGQTPLRIPKCYYSSLVEGKECIYLQDMRNENFRMYRNDSGVDKDHTILVLKELARFHYASIIINDDPMGDLLAKYDFLHPLCNSDRYPETSKEFSGYCYATVKKASEIAKAMGGYEKLENYFKKISSEPDIMAAYCNLLKSIPKFTVICHGDFWNNNTLFRYDDVGNPVEVCMLDFQCIVSSSLSVDLNHFLFISVAAKIREKHLQEFLSCYYESFMEIAKSVNHIMKFTQEDLYKEYRARNLHGILLAATILPIVITKCPGGLETSGSPEDDSKKYLEDLKAEVESHPQFRPRLLESFDEILKLEIL